jgi:hypothetical protein
LEVKLCQGDRLLLPKYRLAWRRELNSNYGRGWRVLSEWDYIFGKIQHPFDLVLRCRLRAIANQGESALNKDERRADGEVAEERLLRKEVLDV